MHTFYRMRGAYLLASKLRTADFGVIMHIRILEVVYHVSSSFKRNVAIGCLKIETRYINTYLLGKINV